MQDIVAASFVNLLMQPGKINLTQEKETLFITLYAKALDSHARHSILKDKIADELIRSIDYDFSKHNKFGRSIIVLRARQFDEWVLDFINRHRNAVVVYLGCGMDTRIARIDPPATVDWFDIDYPDVIQLRKNFFSDSNNYKMIESSITDPAWIQEIPSFRPAIILAEGVLEYVEPEQVKVLLNRITDHFAYGEIIFDVMSTFAVNSAREKLKATTGAVHKWAVDDASEADRLNPKLKRIAEISVFKSPHIRHLPLKQRLLYTAMSFFTRVRNMMRMLRYKF